MRALLPFAACGLASCAFDDPAFRRETPREWLELSAAVSDANDTSLKFANTGATADDALDVGGTLGIAGGIDFLQGAVDTGFELGLFVSQNDLDLDPLLFEDHRTPNAEILRALGGLRSTLDFSGAPISIYSRGGIYFREERFEVPEINDDQSWGWYVGGGIDWRYERCGRMGPFILFLTGEGGGREEWIFGFSARFHIDHE